jgi:hypothetical protein
MRAGMDDRTEHAGYVKAVVRDLNSLGIKVDGLRIYSSVCAVPDDLYGESRAPVRHNPAYPVPRPAPREPAAPIRAASMFVPSSQLWRWPWFEPLDMFASVCWDEEHGWVVYKVFELVGSHGPDRGDRCYGLDLDVVPSPTEVALHIESLFMSSDDSGFNESQPRYRRAADYEPSLESALAAYPPA